MIQVRHELAVDISAIHEVTVKAFGHSQLGHQGEAELIDAIRAVHSDAISLVAVQDEVVLGHLMCSPAKLASKQGTLDGAAIGPLSVLPEWQGKGIGSALIEALIGEATDLGYNFVAVAGHPEFYPRFGFRNLSAFGIRHCFTGMRDELFFIRFLLLNDQTKADGSLLKYCAEFGPQNRFQ